MAHRYNRNAIIKMRVALSPKLDCAVFGAKNEIVLRAIVMNALQISVITL